MLAYSGVYWGMRQWMHAAMARTLAFMPLASQSLSSLTAEQLRELASELLSQVARDDETIARQHQELQRRDGELKYRQAKIDQLTHEMAVLKRWKFGRCRFTFNVSLMNFQLAPNSSTRNVDFPWRRQVSECYQRYSNRESKCSCQDEFSFTPCVKIWWCHIFSPPANDPPSYLPIGSSVIEKLATV